MNARSATQQEAWLKSLLTAIGQLSQTGILRAPRMCFSCRFHSRDIGRLPVQFINRETPLLAGFPDQLTVFHWHSDTFELPAGALHFAHTDICPHQGFLYG